MNNVTKSALVFALSATSLVYAQNAPQQGQPRQTPNGRAVAAVNLQERVDVLKMARPIDAHDTVWIEEMTSLEIRDALKAGKTTALVLGGGMEENGPYLTMAKHNLVVRAMGDSIARRLGNALCAPVLTMEPGNPDKSSSPGSVVMSAETYKGMLADMSASLRAQGFKNIVFLGDHGGDQKPIEEVSKMLNEKWKGSGAKTYYIGDFYDYAGVQKFEEETLGIHEKLEGYHDDYYISSIIMTVDVNGVRLPERIKAHKTTINGVDLMPKEKAIENGKKIVEYRTNLTVKAIQGMLAADASSSQPQQ